MPSPYYPFMSLGGMLNKMYQALFFFLSPRPPLKKKKRLIAGYRSPESVTSDKVVVSPSKLSHVCL